MTKPELVSAIFKASGDMPDPQAHKRYLLGLDEVDLADRLKILNSERLDDPYRKPSVPLRLKLPIKSVQPLQKSYA